MSHGGRKASDTITPGTTTIVLMGVAGAGKTTVMAELAGRLGWPTAEGDDFHSASNVEKMRTGVPLTGEDRGPWLEAIAAWVGERERAGESALVTCSALKRPYRDLLRRGHDSVWFVHLLVPAAVLAARMPERRDHYMPASLLASQLDTLEPLAADEPGIAVPSDDRLSTVVEAILTGVAAGSIHAMSHSLYSASPGRSLVFGAQEDGRMNSKTVRDFNVNGDVTAIADAWAGSDNFDLKGVDPDGTRRYQRGHGLMVNAQHATLRQSGPQVHLEAWTHATMLDRIFSFGMLPANMAVESGGMRGMLPRKMTREAVNRLLAQLGQAPIP